MPLFTRSDRRRRRSVLGRTVGTAIRGVRLLGRGGRLLTRGAGRARARGAGGETGMVRLFDLHAASCAGDTLIAIGLAGTIFFNVPLGEARSKVALYLLVTMVPFALLAPVVGPLLDHFRHGRRYAMAVTMLGRAFLAWLISDYIHGFGLYPAAFGVLALSRAYGVARSAAVPRLLPDGLGLSQVGARASVYGTVAGAVVAPIGLAAFWLGPQWPLRVASVIFLVGMVIALRLPSRADSSPPETVPRPSSVIGFRRGGDRALRGRLVLAALIGSATLRGVYGFLLLFLAFAIKSGDLTTVFLHRRLSAEAALGLVGAALAVGTFLATALGTRLRIHNPPALLSSGMIVVAGTAVLATVRFSLPLVALLCLVTALVSGIAKLAIDAAIQERVAERLRSSAFAHSETALMLAFVAGGAVGLIPFDGRLGIGVAAGLTAAATGWSLLSSYRLRGEKLNGRAAEETTEPTGTPVDGTGEHSRPPVGETGGWRRPAGTDPTPAPPPAPPKPAPKGAPAAVRPTLAQGSATPSPSQPAPTPDGPSGDWDRAGADDQAAAPPGYHIYRPSSAIRGPGFDDDESRHESRGPTG